jgi:hypothetical protein
MAMAVVRRTVVRASDLLVAELLFHNLELDASTESLKPTGAGAPLIVLHLPPQHVTEQRLLPGESPTDEGVAARSRIGGWSRVAFRPPASFASVPFRLDAVLSLLAGCELHVVDAALPRSEDPSPPGCLFALVPWVSRGPTPMLRVPADDETALELPFRLFLSPPRAAGFLHRAAPLVSAAGRVELWHSQLGVAPGTLGTPSEEDRTVRGVWLRTGDDESQVWTPEAPVPTPKPDPDPEYDPFPTTLDHNARHQIVHLSANFGARFSSPSVAIYPRSIPVSRMALTSLGATLDLRGEWQPPVGMSLEEWAHRATLGRDHFVRIVKAGWLFPFGHRASRVDIFERRFDTNASRAALVRTRIFVVTREPLRLYAASTAPTPQLGRTMPLRRLRVRTLITPDLEEPVNQRAFQIREVGGTPVLFHLEGGDQADGGNLAQFDMPLWFVAQDAISTDVGAAVTGFGQHVASVGGEGSTPESGVPLELAVDENQRPSGDSTWHVQSFTWSGDQTSPPAAEPPLPPFHPRAASTALRIPAVEAITGAAAATNAVFHPRYVEHGFSPDQNPGAVVASVSSVALGFADKGDRAGGLVRPELDVRGLSRVLGPVAGAKIDDVASGAFNPSDFFAGALPKLFGVLELDRLIRATPLVEGAVRRAPQVFHAPTGAVLDWEPQLRDYPDAPKAIFVTTPGSRLKLHVEAQAKQPPIIGCTLELFALRLVPDFQCIELHFNKASFVTKAGKPDVDVQLDRIEFVGALSFVERLRRIIPLDGFSDPPAINVTPSGAEATLTLSVPSLTLGMFSLENISFGAGFVVPFDERALAVRFNFCQRQEPFLLTVSALGGGGFFLVELDARGLQRLEAALEFGASLSMNFGVASGGVHVMAGIYFAYETNKGAVLTGYFRAGGNVTALGIVSVSIELYLGLVYEAASGKALGEASLTIEIEVFLFSASVEIRCQRKFAGSASDPSFEQVMRPYEASEEGISAAPAGMQLPAGGWPWQEYWEAYA